ncbi:hypothetical protein GALMADRAFT_254844 [Galerina marginata CBS 339.88]|uniref:F-box domain-containing protein n=1 Tax=Galerina marginata (strain CBS 339.88) TaxID=685588 RepID=A0A067SRR4_GALM3|nr:hypothetical protein GALMADRAFT_254844 [Galerina marginata CBS 339.88]
MASNAVYLPTEITELVIDELDIDGFSDDAKSSRAALRSCLFVSQHFHQRARSHLFRNVELHNGYADDNIHSFRKRLILLRHLLTTSINDHDPGIASNIRKLTISVFFDEDQRDPDDETESVEGGENSIPSRVIAKHFPPVLRLIRQYAQRLENLAIEDNWPTCAWSSQFMPLDLRLALRGLLSMPTLRRLKMQNFLDVPDNLFDCIHVTHLIVEAVYPMEKEAEFDRSNPVPPFEKGFIFGPIEFLETDQSFPLQRIVDISPHQCPDTTKTKLLKKIKIQIHNKFHFTNVVCLLRAAYLAEDLHLDFMGLAQLNKLESNPIPRMNLDLFPLQKLTHLTMSFDDDLYGSSLESGPKSLQIAYSILKTRSCSIMYLTLRFEWYLSEAPNYLIYPRREHWEPFDNILAGPHYPNLCLLALRISFRSPISDDRRSLFKAVFPLLSASNKLRLQ